MISLVKGEPLGGKGLIKKLKDVTNLIVYITSCRCLYNKVMAEEFAAKLSRQEALIHITF